MNVSKRAWTLLAAGAFALIGAGALVSSGVQLQNLIAGSRCGADVCGLSQQEQEAVKDPSHHQEGKPSRSKTEALLLDQLHIHEDFRESFDHGPKGAAYQKYIVLHDTESLTKPEDIISWWDSNKQGVAAHFIVDRDGEIWQCVPMDRIAHHAGYGDTGHNQEFGVKEDGRDDLIGTKPIGKAAADYGMNSWSVGIEMVHRHGGKPYTQAQLHSVDLLIAYIQVHFGHDSKIIDHKAWRSGNSDTDSQFKSYLDNLAHGTTHDGKPLETLYHGTRQ